MLTQSWKCVVSVCFAVGGFLLFSGLIFADAPQFPDPHSEWLQRVPENDRARGNPFANDPQAIRAGQKLFQQNCASCHGKTAEGKGKRPNLRSETIRQATPGELQWLLTNGSLKAGMPSWSRLPEQQRWQLVTYLKTLN